MPTERSAEEIVRAKWPDAYCVPRGDMFIVRRPRTFDDRYSILAFVTLGMNGWQESESEAWADAAARIKASEKEANRDS